MRKAEVAHIWGCLSPVNIINIKYGSFAYLYEECCICGKIRFRGI